MQELITTFDSKSKTYKTPISPTDDKLFTFKSFVCKSNLEMFSIMCTNFILNIPLWIKEPTKTYRRKTELINYYNENITYIILDIDKVKSEFDKQMILNYFKDYKCIIGESRSYDGFSNFNLKGILFTEPIPIEESKNVVAELALELQQYGEVDEAVIRRPTLNAPMLKNTVFINNEDGIRYKYIKKQTIEKINQIKKEYLGDGITINIDEIKDIQAESMEKLCLQVFQNMGFEAMKNNANGSITFKHPTELKSQGGYFWFSQSPYVMHHFNVSRSINIYETVRKLDSAKELLKKELNYDSELLNFNPNTDILQINEKFIQVDVKVQEKVQKFLHAKNGLLSIRSPMGTGKSTIINHIIKECHEEDMKVLIITNRISVAQDFAKKYNIKLYNSDKYEIGDSLVVQFDSLWRYNVKFFDIVIMDEFISLLIHSRNNLNNNSFNIAKFFGCFSKKMVIADAFLTGYESSILNKEHNLHLIDNIYRDDSILYNYTDYNFFIQQIALTAEKGHKFTVSSTSLAFINSLYRLLINKGLKVITLTADTPDGTKKLIYEIFEQENHDKWDALIYSPTLTVGVSNMNNNYYHFHYDSSISTDVISSLQMIKRTRKAKEIHLYIKDKINYLKTSYNDIRDEYLTNIGKNIDQNYLFELDNYGEPRLSEIGRKAVKIDVFKNLLEFNHKEAFFWMSKYHFKNAARIIETPYQSNILLKYTNEIKNEKDISIKQNLEQFMMLSNLDKSNILIDSNADKMLKALIDLEENIDCHNKETKKEILELCLKDNSFIQKCKYYKDTLNFSSSIYNISDIKYRISNCVMKNDKESLEFYNELINSKIVNLLDYYNFSTINKNKKLKYVLDRCGYKPENGDNYKVFGNRGYVIDNNIKNYYIYIR